MNDNPCTDPHQVLRYVCLVGLRNTQEEINLRQGRKKVGVCFAWQGDY